MSKPKTTKRRVKSISLNPDMLETRQLLTGGAGNTFAIMQATITKPNQKIVVPFTLTNTLVSTPNHKLVIGIDVAKNTSSTILPHIVAVQDLSTHKTIPVKRSNYTTAVARINPAQGPQATAVLATININPKTTTHNYAVIISGNAKSTGALLVGFYLPGDTAGGGVVSTSDVNTVKSLNGIQASSTKYSFAADSNRDGVINANDLKVTQQNFGVNVQVSPVISANLSPTTDSSYPNRTTTFHTVLFNGQATPGATIKYSEINKNAAPVTTVADAKGNYAINVTLGNGSNTFGVTSSDGFGQVITGQISPVIYSPKPATTTSSTGG